jgi:predicted ester cyclase
LHVEYLFAGHDTRGARVRATATHGGEFMGVPPTGKQVEVRLIDIMRFDDDGLVREHWGVADMLSLMQQLGVIPA